MVDTATEYCEVETDSQPFAVQTPNQDLVSSTNCSSMSLPSMCSLSIPTMHQLPNQSSQDLLHEQTPLASSSVLESDEGTILDNSVAEELQLPENPQVLAETPSQTIYQKCWRKSLSLADALSNI